MGIWRVMNDSAYTVYSGGTYVVEVSDLFGCSGTDTIEINGSNCLSIFEMDQSGIIVSPNPFFETITFQTQNTDDQQVLQISLYSMSGKLVYSASNVKLNQPIELASLENGIYICEVKSEQHTVDIVKIIKID
ncbi:MAG: T9SS type A sorting domain-containing protein [Crocinitomicaceae bacterium]|nr:T9SS type A sorting domain-containing protein [Crocinitomicaceae bacterium]